MVFKMKRSNKKWLVIISWCVVAVALGAADYYHWKSTSVINTATTTQNNLTAQETSPLTDKNTSENKSDEKTLAGASASSETVRPEDYSKFVVCIDPGHSSDGGDGINKVNGVSEMEINWEVAQRLRTILEGDFKMQVVMTRSERDKVVSNRERAQIANRAHAALFLRLHCDWEASGASSGITTYYPDQPGTVEGKTGPDQQVIAASRRVANSFHLGVMQVIKSTLQDHGIKTDDSTYIGHQQGGALTGSVYSEVPVTLVEMVFLSNSKDAAFIKSSEGQEIMAKALAHGVVQSLEATK